MPDVKRQQSGRGQMAFICQRHAVCATPQLEFQHWLITCEVSSFCRGCSCARASVSIVRTDLYLITPYLSSREWLSSALWPKRDSPRSRQRGGGVKRTIFNDDNNSLTDGIRSLIVEWSYLWPNGHLRVSANNSHEWT